MKQKMTKVKLKRSFKTRTAGDFGAEKVSMVPITPKVDGENEKMDGIDAFKNSIVEVDFEVTNHGEFK